MLAAEVKRVEIRNYKVVALAPHDEEGILWRFFCVNVFRRSLRRFGHLHLGFENPGLIGLAGGQSVLGSSDFYIYAFVRLTRLTIDDVNDDLSVPIRLLDHREVGDHGERVSPHATVDAFD